MLRGGRNRAAVVSAARRDKRGALEALIGKVAFYLESSAFLPFWGDPFRVRPPSKEIAEIDAPTIRLDLVNVNWKPGQPGQSFGYLNVAVERENDALVIEDIDTHRSFDGTPVETRKRAGCELVRRLFLLAADEGLRYVRTTRFLIDAAAFWIGRGFDADEAVKPDWAAIGDKGLVAHWQREIVRSRQGLWVFASTPAGRSALRNQGGSGFVDLNDFVQRRYVARRLNLGDRGLC